MPNPGFLLPLIGQYVPAWWRAEVPSHRVPDLAETIGEQWHAGASEAFLPPDAWVGNVQEVLDGLAAAEHRHDIDSADSYRCELAGLVLARFAYRGRGAP